MISNFSTDLGKSFIDSNYATNIRSITLYDVARILGINYFESDDWLLKDLSNNSADFANYNKKKENLLELTCDYFIASEFTHSSNSTGGMYYYHADGKNIYYAGNWFTSGVRVVIELKPDIRAYKTNLNTGTNSNSPYLLMY